MELAKSATCQKMTKAAKIDTEKQISWAGILSGLVYHQIRPWWKKAKGSGRYQKVVEPNAATDLKREFLDLRPFKNYTTINTCKTKTTAWLPTRDHFTLQLCFSLFRRIFQPLDCEVKSSSREDEWCVDHPNSAALTNLLTPLPPVVGVDFGTLNTVIAVARNRGVDVIVNEVR